MQCSIKVNQVLCTLNPAHVCNFTVSLLSSVSDIEYDKGNILAVEIINM